jgi:hypothetical protein
MFVDSRRTLLHLCETLKKLVIYIPLRSHYPEYDYISVRRILTEAFERPVNLDGLVSTQDEL